MDLLILLQKWCQQLNKTTLFNLILFFLLFVSCFLYLFKVITRKKLNLPPSPPKLPIIGNFHQVGALLHRVFQALSEKYGPVMLLHLGNTPTLIVSSAEVARDVLMKSNDAFSQRPQTRAVRALFFRCKDVAFSPFGDYWRVTKKICVQELLNQRRVQAFQFVREEEVSNIIGKIRLSSLNGAVVDLTEMLAVISNNIISKTVFGRVYEGEGNKSFAGLSKTAMDLMGAFCFEDLFPFLGWMDHLTGLTTKLRRTSEALHSLLDQVIEEHQVSKSDQDDKSDKEDFVDLLLHLQKGSGLDIDLTQENVKAILLDMFIGGTDNTATILDWTMAELVKHPSIMKKAQEEVRRVVGEKSKVEETDVNQMDYLKCIVKEGMRLHAPVMLTRATVTDTKLEGYDIPPKTIVLINAWAIQRDPKLWDRPEEFIPERFANTQVDFSGQHGHFIPFGGGRRSCPGIAFAAIEMEYILANLLHWFDWTLPDCGRGEDLDMSDVYMLVLRRKFPLRLIPVMHSS